MKYRVRVHPKNGMFFKTFLVCSQLIFLNTFSVKSVLCHFYDTEMELPHLFAPLPLVAGVSLALKRLDHKDARVAISCSELASRQRATTRPKCFACHPST